MQDIPAAAPTASDIPTSAPTITNNTLCTLLDEVNQRLNAAEAVNALLVAEVDALAAEVAQLKASAT
jgi:cell division protein FtsB